MNKTDFFLHLLCKIIFTKCLGLITISKNGLMVVVILTFSEILIVVWNRIETLSARDEIKKTLNTEIQDAECKCLRALARPSGYWQNITPC